MPNLMHVAIELAEWQTVTAALVNVPDTVVATHSPFAMSVLLSRAFHIHTTLIHVKLS